MKIKSFYHSTNQENLLSILRNKRLNVIDDCVRIGGLNSDDIYLSDLYHKYLSVVFGSVIIKFNADSLLAKNNIVPTVYDKTYKDDFLDMPFEEAEWSSKKVVFDYKDIEKIIFIVSDTDDGEIASVIQSLIEYESINIDWEDQEGMPEYSYEYCLERYHQRKNSYAI